MYPVKKVKSVDYFKMLLMTDDNSPKSSTEVIHIAKGNRPLFK